MRDEYDFSNSRRNPYDLRLYILEGHEVRKADSLMAWGRWMESADRQVARTTLPDGSDISTVFLGLDHAFGSGPPVLFETAYFVDPATVPATTWEGRELRSCDVLERYSTWAEAECGHQEWLDKLHVNMVRPAPVKGTT